MSFCRNLMLVALFCVSGLAQARERLDYMMETYSKGAEADRPITFWMPKRSAVPAAPQSSFRSIRPYNQEQK